MKRLGWTGPSILVIALAALTLLTSSPAFAQVDTATVQGTVHDATGAVVPAATVTLLNVDMGVSFQTKTNDVRSLSISFRPDWPLYHRGRGDGLCSLDARRHRAQHPAALRRRLHAEAQQHCRDRHRDERCGRAPDPGGVAWRRRPVEGHQRSAAERPQLHLPRPAERRRRAGAAGYARHGRQRQLLRERPEQLRQQLPARRRRQQLQPRRLRQRRGLRVPAVGRRAAGVQGADQQLQRRAWPGERRRAQCQPEIGRRAVPRQPVRVLSKLCDGRDQLLRRVPGSGERQVQPQPVRVHPRWSAVLPSTRRQADILLHQLRGHHCPPGDHLNPDGPDRPHAAEQLHRHVGLDSAPGRDAHRPARPDVPARDDLRSRDDAADRRGRGRPRDRPHRDGRRGGVDSRSARSDRQQPDSCQPHESERTPAVEGISRRDEKRRARRELRGQSHHG